jgi:glycosyltransferase involved in cell wall biosynthesis
MAAHDVRNSPMNHPSHILHVIDSLDGYGHARMLRELAKRQADAGAEVTVAALHADRDIAAELCAAGVAVQIIGRRWPFDPIAALRLRRLRGAGSTRSIVHTWDAASLVHAACLSRRRPGARLLANLNATEVDSGWWPRALSYLHPRVDRFIVPDGDADSQLRRLGVAPERIQKMPPAIPPATAFNSERANWRERFEFPADAKIIATAGPLLRRKALDEVVWCFELVRVLYPHARLLILGDGPDRNRLERFADEVSEPGCIRFLGYRADIAELLPHVDVYWQLDAARNLPLALLEAQAAAVPVVVSDVPVHRTAIRPYESGFVVPLGHRAAVTRATDDLFKDAALRKTIGAAGAALVRTRWSIESALAAYDQLYAAVLND